MTATAASIQTTDSQAPSAPRGGSRVVACQRLSKVFRDFWMRPRVRAVEDLTFDIEPHEVFGLLGPNGSGKSTTIKMILGLLHPSKGRLVVFGKPPTDVAIKSRIGYLPEESFLYPFLNARETLDYYAKLFEIDAKVRKRRIDELLDMVGLTAAQHRPVREYSKGMQRRIGLAQALINDPDFLILDEPTTGLDPIGTRQVKDLIVELGRRGKTILLSSHLLADVEDVVDRMIILYGGKKRDEGTTDQLLTKHGKTTIETDDLDEATIAEIDRIIRERSGGERSILRVSHPRQKLEEKFLDIVERAQQDRLETSGAANDGQTAAFLAAQSEEPDAVIDRLMNEESFGEQTGQDDRLSRVTSAATDHESEPAPAGRASDPVPEPEASVLKSLMTDDDAVDANGSSPAPRRDAAETPAAEGAGGASDDGATAQPDAAAEDVDASVIDSLLGGDASDDGDQEAPR
ncbi:MAG: ABC transporter ATP-binding protein [Planctomycetota bacterium]